MKLIIPLLLACTLIISGCAHSKHNSSSAKTASSKPNIIYILADDLGYGDVGAMSTECKIQTPNMNRMADEGMVFTDAHSGSAVCTPTRYGILTGRYSWRTFLKRGVLWGDSWSMIKSERVTVASFLKEQGYNTACIGKWHLGLKWQTLDGKQPPGKPDDSTTNVDWEKPILHGPNQLGFDYYYGISASLDMFPYFYIENDRITASKIIQHQKSGGKKFWRSGPGGEDFKHIDVLDELTDKTVSYIKKQSKDKPFFIYFPLPAPHKPIIPEDRFQNKSAMNEWADFVMQVDWTAGRIMDALAEKGIADNTLLIVTSDNGATPGADFKKLAEYGHDPSGPLRGHKADIFEGGHRIPFIAMWPNVINAKSRISHTVCLTDLLATAADINGKKLPDNAGEDSVSMLPYFKGHADKALREATVHHSAHGAFAIRKDNWKLILGPGSGGWSEPRKRKKNNNLADLPQIQLYNLESDLAETTNLYDKYPEKVEELSTLLQSYVDKGRSTPGAPQSNFGKTDIYKH